MQAMIYGDLNDLTPYIIQMELTHLGSEISINYIINEMNI